jgi:hypothetical protein
MTQELSDRRLQNQLEALRAAIRGTNADLIKLTEIIQQSGCMTEPIADAFIGNMARRIESLGKLSLSQKTE